MCPVQQDGARSRPRTQRRRLRLSRALRSPCSVQRLVPHLGERGDAGRSPGRPESHLLHLRAGDPAHAHPRALQSDRAGRHADGRPEEVRAARGGSGRGCDRGRGEEPGRAERLAGRRLLGAPRSALASQQRLRKNQPARSCCRPGKGSALLRQPGLTLLYLNWGDISGAP